MLTLADKSGNKIIEVIDNRYDGHVLDVAANLRKSDYDEMFASDGVNPYQGVLESWRLSLKRWIMINNKGEAVAVLGVTPADIFSNIGVPWLLGTDGLEKMKKFFVKVSRPIIEEMKFNFKMLINFVDARYIKAIKWLEWCGFIIEPAKEHGAIGLPFHKFYMEIT